MERRPIAWRPMAPARQDDQTRVRTRLAKARVKSQLTQDEMSALTGMSRATYIRLEQGRMANPPLRYLVNCALVLRVRLEAILEEEWRSWMPSERAPAPPEWSDAKL
jgi:transcriptional regulator with XRE-family HTH domain